MRRKILSLLVETLEKNSKCALSSDSRDSMISVIIPAFNEEKTLSRVLERTHDTLRNLGTPYEIIVVNDGSTDETANVALQNDVTLVSNGQNCGKGQALASGIAKAKGSILVTMDADGSHQPEEIPKLLYPIMADNPGSRIVVGSRFLGNLEENAISHVHFIGNKIFNLLIKLLTGTGITDSQSGFRAYRREVLENLNIRSTGFEIETEMIMSGLKEGFSIEEVPITCKRRTDSVSRLHTFRDGFSILKIIVEESLM